MIEFQCSGCGYSKLVDDKLLDRKVICPKCKRTSRVRPVESLTVEVAGPPKFAASKAPKFRIGLFLAITAFALTVVIAGWWWTSGHLADSPNEMPKKEKIPAAGDNIASLESENIDGYQRRKLERTLRELSETQQKLVDTNVGYWKDHVAFSRTFGPAERLNPTTEEEEIYISFLVNDLKLMESHVRKHYAAKSGDGFEEHVEHSELVIVAIKEFHIKFPYKAEK